MMHRNSMYSVRDEFAFLLKNGTFTSVNRESTMTSLVGSRTIEIINASFIASDERLFGTVDQDYVKREEQWYDSMSRNVNDIPGGPPAVWKAIASSDGMINSNYGWCVYSHENGAQFDKVVAELKKNPESRRAEIIYTRPTMWDEYNIDGRSDFMCTDATQYFVRNGTVHACVRMRSNDAILGMKNDRAWQHTVQCRIASELNLPVGELHWNAGSLHVYARHFYLVDHYTKTGELTITKSQYRELYPQSVYNEVK